MQVPLSAVRERHGHTWLPAGTSTQALDVSRHPQFLQPAPGPYPIGDTTVSRNGHCTRVVLQLYSKDGFVVGDLLELLAFTELCDPPNAEPMHALQVKTTVTPPAGCTARPWMYKMTGGGIATSAPLAAGATGGMYRYRDGKAVPPDFAPQGIASGAPAMIVPNCPGVWSFRMQSAVSPATNGDGQYTRVNVSVFTFTVLPQS